MKKFLHCLFAWLISGHAWAADDISATFQKHFIESRMKAAIADQLRLAIDEYRRNDDPELPELGVQIAAFQLARVDVSRFRVTATIGANDLANPNDTVFQADAAFTARFGCSGLDLDVPVTIESLKFRGFSYPVEDIQIRVNEKISALTRGLRETIQRELPSPSRVRCPRVEIRPDMSIVMTVDLRPLQCHPGQSRHNACSRNQWGEGITYGCANGFWTVVSRWCESCADSPHPSCPRRPGRPGRSIPFGGNDPFSTQPSGE